jgi:hypothetical protein
MGLVENAITHRVSHFQGLPFFLDLVESRVHREDVNMVMGVGDPVDRPADAELLADFSKYLCILVAGLTWTSGKPKWTCHDWLSRSMRSLSGVKAFPKI